MITEQSVKKEILIRAISLFLISVFCILVGYCVLPQDGESVFLATVTLMFWILGIGFLLPFGYFTFAYFDSEQMHGYILKKSQILQQERQRKRQIRASIAQYNQILVAEKM